MCTFNFLSFICWLGLHIHSLKKSAKKKQFIMSIYKNGIFYVKSININAKEFLTG